MPSTSTGILRGPDFHQNPIPHSWTPCAQPTA